MVANPVESSSGAKDSYVAPDEVILAERYRLLFEAPIPEFDLAGAPAFAARDLRNPGRALFARVLEPNLQPRIDAAIQLKLVREARIMVPLEWGPVSWGAGTRRFAVLFDRPDTGPLMPSMDARAKPLSADEICRKVLGPALLTLTDFARRGITHRAIRPTNLYLLPGSGSLLLGDCVSALPAWHQPAACESVESAMTQPAGRGPGTIADDLYALGATILFLALGRCPVAGMPEGELIAAKLERDSLTALSAGERTPPALREALRGLLADEPAERWTLDDLAQWLGGGLRRQVQPPVQRRFDRGYEFNGREFRNLRLLADAFGKDWNPAVQQLRTRTLETWLKRSLPDHPFGMEVAAAVNAAQHDSNPSVAEGKMVTRVCTHLDPGGPMRFKGTAVTVEGLGSALAYAMLTDDRAAALALSETIAKGLVIDWCQLRAVHVAIDLDGISKTFKRLQQFLRQSGPGYGIERCIYEMNPYLPCLSPMLAGRYIHTLGELLPVLERLVARQGALPSLVDRHIVAFVSSHFNKRIDTELAAMDDGRGDSIRAKLGIAGLFAKLQEQYGPETLPSLTAWLAKEIAPASGHFHSKTLREQVRRNLGVIAGGGSIPELVRCLNDESLRARDEQARLTAIHEYAATLREVAELQSRNFLTTARMTGWRLAARTSTVIGIGMGFAIAIRLNGGL